MSSVMIGKLQFNDHLLNKDLEVISTFPILEEEYAEFGTGTWRNYSLWNKSGDHLNTQYSDFDDPAKITQFGDALPYIKQLIEDNFDISYLKMVRIRNLINGMVVPHKDFVELNSEKKKYLRVFIPLEQNTESYHSDEYSVFQMQKGEIWRLDASIIHAAVNFGTSSRVHLCLDFQYDDAHSTYENIFKNKAIIANKCPPTLANRPPLNQTELLSKLNELQDKITSTNLLTILESLSTIHFTFDVNISKCYEWLMTIAKNAESEAIIEKCTALKKYMVEERALGERFAH